jgi:hypothetical protein
VALFSGSVAFHEGDYPDRQVHPIATVNTPNGYCDVSTMAGFSIGLSPFSFLTGYHAGVPGQKEPTEFGLMLGVDNVAAVSIGQLNARGPGRYAWGPFFYGSLGAGPIGVNGYLFYPPLRFLTRYVDAPARRIQGMRNWALDRVVRAARGVGRVAGAMWRQAGSRKR